MEKQAVYLVAIYGEENHRETQTRLSTHRNTHVACTAGDDVYFMCTFAIEFPFPLYSFI